MVWNIIKKDWKLMGRHAIGVIALQLLFQLPQMQGQLFDHRIHTSFLLMDPMAVACILLWPLVAVVWVVALVHQDPLPGTRQDWLTRPIPRRDMLLAKVIFATAVLQGSTILGDLIQGLANGFSLGQSLRAALARAAIGFVLFTLPALLLGVLTQSISETAVMAAVLSAGAFVLMAISATLVLPGHTFDPTAGSAIHWIPNLLRLFLILTFGAALLALQYRTRNTSRGRIALAALIVLLFCTQILPWTPIFAVQKRLSPQRGTADSIAISWSPTPGLKDPVADGHSSKDRVPVRRAVSGKWARLRLPVVITGIPADSMLVGDNSSVVITGTDGKNLDKTLHAIDGGGLSLPPENTANGPTTLKQLTVLPAELYRQNQDRLVHLETTYFMTLFKLSGSYSIPAVGGDVRIPGFGHCVSNIAPGNTMVLVNCTQMGSAPLCATAYMEDPRDGSRDRNKTDCSPDYAPYRQQPTPDAMTHFGFFFQFRNEDDYAGSEGRFPVDATKVEHAQIVIRVYKIAEHFTRVMNSPLIALKDVAEK